MTRKEIMSLKVGPKTDAIIAQWRGWEPKMLCGQQNGWWNPEGSWRATAPAFSTDHNAAMEMQENIPEEKRPAYTACLAEAVPCVPSGYTALAEALTYAKPLPRCHALLLLEATDD